MSLRLISTTISKDYIYEDLS